MIVSFSASDRDREYYFDNFEVEMDSLPNKGDIIEWDHKRFKVTTRVFDVNKEGAVASVVVRIVRL